MGGQAAIIRLDNAMGSCVLVSYGNVFNDPSSRHTTLCLAREDWHVTVIQGLSRDVYASGKPGEVCVQECRDSRFPVWTRAAQRLDRWRIFRQEVRCCLERTRPDLVVTIMLHALAALPEGPKRYRLVSCVYDIPCLRDAGRLDARILARAWRRLRQADVVWSSDRYKAEHTQKYGNLTESPIVCHNCPPLDYLPEPTWPRDGWLRAELRRQGPDIGENACILLRAGAVGECGGIEATLQAMRQLPGNLVFLMMGRPTREYRDQLLRMINNMGLQGRALLWEKSSDETWKQALLGADIGHMVQGPFPPGRLARLYELNSSLSNNRLFQYMAAGLPIISYDDPRMTGIHSEVDCFRVLRTNHLVEDIHEAIVALGSNTGARMAMGRVGHQAHKRTYNWEKQFAPVLEAIDGRQCTPQLLHVTSK